MCYILRKHTFTYILYTYIQLCILQREHTLFYHLRVIYKLTHLLKKFRFPKTNNLWTIFSDLNKANLEINVLILALKKFSCSDSKNEQKTLLNNSWIEEETKAAVTDH